jgi:hypothetical protein
MAQALVDQWNVKLADELEDYLPHMEEDTIIGTNELLCNGRSTHHATCTILFPDQPIAKNNPGAKWAIDYILKHLKDKHTIDLIYMSPGVHGHKEWGLRFYDSFLSKWSTFCDDLRNLPCSKLTNGGSLLELSQNFCTDTPGAWGWWEYVYWPESDGNSYLRNNLMYYEIDIVNINTTSDLLFWIRQISHKNKNKYGESVLDDLLWAFNDILGKLHLIPHEFKAIDLMNAYEQRVFGAKNNIKRSMPTKLRHQILERDGFKCMDCGKSPQTHGVTLEVDHRLPFSKGGSNDPSNLRTLCSDCNGGKSDRIIDYPEGHQ